MANSWDMTWVGFVKKIRNATQLISLRLGELVAEPHIKCPNCECGIDISNVSLVWPALPAGVKFDPSDVELLQHLQGKSSLPNSNSRAIDEFIPTIEEMEGICYTHPQNLPGIKMDGSSIHFFHRVSNAYGRGQRKRRKISDGDDVSDEHIRWHKTGKSKVICDENGAKIGWKKILVLYSGSKRGGGGGKIDRNSWVMHQYHLGLHENEMNGEFVVSKIFYQSSSKKNGKPETCDVVLESDAQIDPRTLKVDPHQPLHLNNGSCLTEQYTPVQVDQGGENCGTSIYRVKEEGAGSPACFDGPQAVMDADLPASNEPVQPRDVPDAGLEALYNELPELDPPYLGAPSGLSTSLADMPLGSPDSLWGWMLPDIC